MELKRCLAFAQNLWNLRRKEATVLRIQTTSNAKIKSLGFLSPTAFFQCICFSLPFPVFLVSFNSLNRSTDIGHVDFLEKVHQLAEKPYIIAGLHFDQVCVSCCPKAEQLGPCSF